MTEDFVPDSLASCHHRLRMINLLEGAKLKNRDHFEGCIECIRRFCERQGIELPKEYGWPDAT